MEMKQMIVEELKDKDPETRKEMQRSQLEKYLKDCKSEKIEISWA